jgi:hypothetical protein
LFTIYVGAPIEASALSNLLPFPTGEPDDQPGQNQGHFVPPGEGYVWQSLRFRTQSEVAIAREFDAAKVLFFPQCACRITGPTGRRVTREPDFLVIYRGTPGILELDGAPHDGRAADDHRRDRLFKLRGGIWVIERVSSQYALQYPREVVRGFLQLLETYRQSA